MAIQDIRIGRDKMTKYQRLAAEHDRVMLCFSCLVDKSSAPECSWILE